MNLWKLLTQLLAHFLFLKEPSSSLRTSLGQPARVFARLFQMLFFGNQVHMFFDKGKSVLSTVDKSFEAFDFIFMRS